MNILIFINPFETHGIPFNAARGMVDKLPNIVRAMTDSGFSADVLTSQPAARFMRQKSSAVFSGVDRVFELDTDGLATLAKGNPALGSQNFASLSVDSAWVSKVQEVLKRCGCLTHYDLVLCPFTETHAFKEVFPRSKVVFFETGLVCHLPFQQFHVFDPYGTFQSGAYFSKHKETDIGDEVEAYEPILNEVGSVIRSFSRKYLAEAGGRSALRRDFSRVALLPLQVSDSPSFQGAVPFKSQFAFLDFILSQIPSDVGLLVTEHPSFPQITATQHEYLSETYPSYIYSPRLQRLWSPSCVALPAVDAVISVSSTVLLQAHALGLRAFSVGDGAFSAMNTSPDLGTFIADLANGVEFTTPRRRILDILARYSVPMGMYQSPEIGRYLEELVRLYDEQAHTLPIIAEPDVLLPYYKAQPFPKTLIKKSTYFSDQWSAAPLAMSLPDEAHQQKTVAKAKKHTIAVMLDHFGIGGTQRVVQRLIRRMPDVQWVIIVEKRIDEEFEQADNCEILVCGTGGSTETSVQKIVNCIRSRHRISPISAFLNPMHWREAALRAMPLVKTVLNIPVIYWEHNSFFFPFYIANSDLHTARRETVEAADAVVLLGEHDESLFASAFPEASTRVIRNPVPNFAKNPTPFGMRDNVILVVGRFDPQKRMDRSIAIMKSLHGQHPDWRMVILGDGYLRPEVQKAIDKAGLGEVIELAGYHADPSHYFSTASIVAILSDFEGDPLTLMEAKAFGLPVVAFELFQNTRLRHEVDGLYVEQADTDAFASELARLIANSSLRQAMGAAARESYETQYDEAPEDDWRALFDLAVTGEVPKREVASVPESATRESLHVMATLQDTMQARMSQRQSSREATQGSPKSSPEAQLEINNLRNVLSQKEAHIAADAVMLEERFEAMQAMSKTIQAKEAHIASDAVMLEERYEAMQRMQQKIEVLESAANASILRTIARRIKRRLV